MFASLGCMSQPIEPGRRGAEPQVVASAEALCGSTRDLGALSEYYRAEIQKEHPERDHFESCAVSPLVESEEITRSCADLHLELHAGREAQLAQRRVAARSIKLAMLKSLKACVIAKRDGEGFALPSTLDVQADGVRSRK
jgi:hypothetical protein